jgi:outer membrane protein TolC
MLGCGPVAGEAGLSEALLAEAERYRVIRVSTDKRAPPQLDERSSLPDYLAYAALNNPGLEAAFHRLEAAVAGIPQARALPDPRLTFGWFITEVETRVGPQQAKVGISQMFPWRGKRDLRGEVALHAARAAHARYDAAKLKLFHRVSRAYWEYWYLARTVAVTEENLRLLVQIESVARRKYTAGTAPHSAVIKAQVELGELEDRLRALLDLRAPASASLEAALGRAPGEPLPWPKDAPAHSRIELRYEELVARLRERRPELRAAGGLAAREKASVALARRDSYPDVGLGLDYVFTGYSTMTPPPSDSGKDPVLATFSVTLPLDREKHRAAEREAESRSVAADLEKLDMENELAAGLAHALYSFRDAERKLDLYGNTLLPKASQALEVARTAFEADRATFLDLIDAQRTLLEFGLARARAMADRAISLSELKMLVGTDVSGTEEQEEGRIEAPTGAGVSE